MRNIALFVYLWISLRLSVFADDVGIFKGLPVQGEETQVSKIRNGNFTFDDIPSIIAGVTDIILGLTGTISLVVIVIGAIMLAIGSVQQDKQKGKDTIVMGLVGFVVSAFAWFIINVIISNL